MVEVTPPHWSRLTGAAILWRIQNALPTYSEQYGPTMKTLRLLMDELNNESFREAQEVYYSVD